MTIGWTADDDTDAVSATTQTGAPGRPVDFSEPETAADDDEVGEITLLWDPPLSTGGSDITGYQLQVLDVSTRTWVDEATFADDDELTYTDEDLEPGKLYYYILRAVNDISVGAWTPFVTATAEIGLPDAPMLTATAASGTTIDLSWTLPADNGTPITGYDIRQWDPPAGGTDDDGEWGDTNLLVGDRASELVNEFTVVTGLAPGNRVLLSNQSLDGYQRRGTGCLVS